MRLLMESDSRPLDVWNRSTGNGYSRVTASYKRTSPGYYHVFHKEKHDCSCGDVRISEKAKDGVRVTARLSSDRALASYKGRSMVSVLPSRPSIV